MDYNYNYDLENSENMKEEIHIMIDDFDNEDDEFPTLEEFDDSEYSYDDLDLEFAIWYYGNTCHHCGKESDEDHLHSINIVDSHGWTIPEDLVVLCDECYNSDSIDMDKCIEHRKTLGNHKMVLAFREYHKSVKRKDAYNYINDIIQVLQGHFEYIDCVDIEAPYQYRGKRSEDFYPLDYDQIRELIVEIYNILRKEGELCAEYY